MRLSELLLDQERFFSSKKIFARGEEGASFSHPDVAAIGKQSEGGLFYYSQGIGKFMHYRRYPEPVKGLCYKETKCNEARHSSES